MVAFAIGALIYSIYHWRRTGAPMFLMMFISGGCMVAMEAAIDTLGGCWFPRIHSWVAFTAYGRPIPVWMIFAYFFYFGILGGVFWSVMRDGITARGVWGLFVLGAVGDAIFEIILLHFHTYIYYGGQPLRLLRFPFWWAPVNSLIVVALAGVIARAGTYFSGWRAVLIIPTAVSVSAAVNALAGWPSWLVINSKMPWLPRQIGGIVTLVISCWIVGLVVRLVVAPATPTVTDPRLDAPVTANTVRA
jgi:hypothetical protein